MDWRMLQAPPAKSGAKARGRIRRKSIFEQNLFEARKSEIRYLVHLPVGTDYGLWFRKGGCTR